MTRVRALRKQVEALEAFRDAMSAAMDGEDWEKLVTTMLPTTSRILSELEGAERGMGPSHPFTLDERNRAVLWWELLPTSGGGPAA